MSALHELETAVGEAAETYGRAVVGLGAGWGIGSGFVVASGQVVTNAHALRREELTVTFSDGRAAPAVVLGADPDLDVAVLGVDTGEIEPLPWLSVADGDERRAEPAIGRAILALGNPGGRGLRVTPGFVSAVQRSFRGPRGRRIGGAIEHTAPLPRGSSGGPLLDLEGTLLGINAVRADRGLILALPADGTTRERVLALGRGEPVAAPRLGVGILPPRASRRLRRAVGLPERDGVLIRVVQEGGAADRAGLQRGDLIVAAGGSEVTSADALYDALDAAGTAGALELSVLRGADELAVKVRF
jgi:serine protease Do